MQSKTFFGALIFIIFLTVCGCATPLMPKIEKPIENSRIYNVPFETGWNALTRVVTLTGGTVTVAQKENGLISIQKKLDRVMTSKIALVPRNLNLGKSEVTINFNAIKKDENKTQVFITSRIWSWTVNFWAMTPIQQELGSNGALEKEYLDKIQDEVVK